MIKFFSIYHIFTYYTHRSEHFLFRISGNFFCDIFLNTILHIKQKNYIIN